MTKKKSIVFINDIQPLWSGRHKKIISPAIGTYQTPDLKTEYFYFGVKLPSEIGKVEKSEEGNRTWIEEGEEYYLARNDFLISKTHFNDEPIEFSVEPNSLTRWSKESIQDYYSRGNLGIPLVEEYLLIDDLIAILKEHIELRDEREYALIALWIMGTYIHTLLGTYPYLFIYGTKGTGKTTLLNLIAYFSFNGQFWSKPSASNVFRFINIFQATLAIDELELTKEKIEKIENDRDLYSILLNGYKAGAKVPRSDENDLNNIKLYPVFSPKALAGIKEMAEMLRDRSIEIIITKSERSFPMFKDTPEMQALRDKMYVWALENWKNIREKYKGMESEPLLVGRERELWQPILGLADAFQKLPEIRELMKEKVEWYRGEDMIEGDDGRILRILKNYITPESGWHFLGDLKKSFAEEIYADTKEDTAWISERYVGRLLKRLGLIERKRLMNGRTQIYLDHKKFEETIKKYKLEG